MTDLVDKIVRLFQAKPSRTQDSAKLYAELRGKMLAWRPQKFADENEVAGFLMDTAYSNGIATLVAINEGAVSLYYSTGGGLIGLGNHEGPRRASRELLDFARNFAALCVPSKEYPLPKAGDTGFCLITARGTLTAEAKEDDLGNNRLPLSPLFHKAHVLITEARKAPKQSRTNAPPQSFNAL